MLDCFTIPSEQCLSGSTKFSDPVKCFFPQSLFWVRLFAWKNLQRSPSASWAQPDQAPVHGAEQWGNALHREYCPPDRLQEPADGARGEAHEHRHVMCEQEEAACQLLAILHHQVHPAVKSSHSTLVHDEHKFYRWRKNNQALQRRRIKLGSHHVASRRSETFCVWWWFRGKTLWFLCGCDVIQMTTSCKNKQLVTLHEGNFRVL